MTYNAHKNHVLYQLLRSASEAELECWYRTNAVTKVRRTECYPLHISTSHTPHDVPQRSTNVDRALEKFKAQTKALKKLMKRVIAARKVAEAKTKKANAARKEAEAKTKKAIEVRKVIEAKIKEEVAARKASEAKIQILHAFRLKAEMVKSLTERCNEDTFAAYKSLNSELDSGHTEPSACVDAFIQLQIEDQVKQAVVSDLVKMVNMNYALIAGTPSA